MLCGATCNWRFSAINDQDKKQLFISRLSFALDSGSPWTWGCPGLGVLPRLC